MDRINIYIYRQSLVVDSVLQGSDNEEAYASSVKNMIPREFSEPLVALFK